MLNGMWGKYDHHRQKNPAGLLPFVRCLFFFSAAKGSRFGLQVFVVYHLFLQLMCFLAGGGSVTWATPHDSTLPQFKTLITQKHSINLSLTHLYFPLHHL